jgi:hypothetical protein
MVFCHYSPMNFRRLFAAIICLGLLTGCAAGGDAPTRMIREVTDGVETDVGDLKLRNVKVVALPDGSGTLIGYIVNHNDAPDQLVAISINGKMAEVQGDGSLLKNDPVIFEGDSANAKAKVALLGEKAGYRVPVVFYFAKSGKVELDTLIVPNTGIYSSIL